jgi:hypothetical protein
MKSFTVITFISLMTINCASNKIFLDNYSPAQPARVAVSIELTDQAQSSAADSLVDRLSKRLALYSEERKDFILVKLNEQFDYKLTIRVNDMNLVGTAKQDSLFKERNSIHKKYDDTNDSLLAAYKPQTSTELAAKIIAASVGIISVSMISDPGPKQVWVSRSDRNKLNALYTQSYLVTHLTLSGKNDSILWQEPHEELLKLSTNTDKKEQIGILIRNTLFYLESKVPFFILPEN